MDERNWEEIVKKLGLTSVTSYDELSRTRYARNSKSWFDTQDGYSENATYIYVGGVKHMLSTNIKDKVLDFKQTPKLLREYILYNMADGNIFICKSGITKGDTWSLGAEECE